MPKLKPGTIFPTQDEDQAITKAAISDADSIPLTDDEWEKVSPARRRGRPLGSGSKEQLTVRFDIEIIDKFRETGAGWQKRMNDALKDWLSNHTPA
jgi:uncharacterized protein (DUF4415 family)